MRWDEMRCELLKKQFLMVTEGLLNIWLECLRHNDFDNNYLNHYDYPYICPFAQITAPTFKRPFQVLTENKGHFCGRETKPQLISYYNFITWRWCHYHSTCLTDVILQILSMKILLLESHQNDFYFEAHQTISFAFSLIEKEKEKGKGVVKR